jgi:hypothetical protein
MDDKVININKDNTEIHHHTEYSVSPDQRASEITRQKKINT